MTILTCCERTFNDETAGSDLSFNNEMVKWQDVKNQLNPGSNIVFVQREGSIQEAINEAEPGDLICIEPGIFSESLSIKKPDLKLIGLTTSDLGSDIFDNPEGREKYLHAEIIDIQLLNYLSDKVDLTQLQYSTIPNYNRTNDLIRKGCFDKLE